MVFIVASFPIHRTTATGKTKKKSSLTMLLRSNLLLSALALLISNADAFTATSIRPIQNGLRQEQLVSALSMVSTSTDSATETTTNEYAEDDIQDDLTSKGLLKRDRYVATNRFAVRPGKEAKFEAR